MQNNSYLTLVEDPSLAETRKQIWDEAPPALRAEIEWFHERIDEMSRDGIRIHHELGMRLKAIYDDENDKNGRKYGSNAVKTIATYFELDQSLIYNCLKLARAFTPAEIEEFYERRMPNGQLLTYSHLLTLATVSNPVERRRLLESTLAESWTYDNLTRQLCPVKSKSIKDGRGRPLGVPRSLDLLLEQIDVRASEFIERAQKVWLHNEHNLAEKLFGLHPDGLTREKAAKIKAVAEKLEVLAETAKHLADEAQTVHEMFVSRMPITKAKDTTSSCASQEETDHEPVWMPDESIAQKIVYSINNLTSKAIEDQSQNANRKNVKMN